MSLNDKVNDVIKQIQNDVDMYVTMHGRVLKRSEKLRSSGVTDGCTIQVTSRMRGGGRHKDRRSRSEKKQAASANGNEQKSVEELESGRGPALLNTNGGAVDRMIAENEGYQEFVERLSKGSDVDMEHELERYLATAKGFIGQGQRQVGDVGERNQAGG